MTRAGPLRKIRCAVYTRKSSEEGLDQAFNSLDAQREACEAYIASQRHEGWIAVPDRYDDGGVSGGTLERPALQRLLRDIEADLVDVVVVYKVDRLSRSLTDFARLVEVFDRHGVSFVWVTQAFNTTTSMGRLTLNILLSFAQFEREVTAERIRDKFRSSRAKGMWMGGHPPLGYDVENRKLVVNETEAALVRRIFERFVALGSATLLVKELNADGCRTKSWTTQSGRQREGRPFDKGYLYRLLNNRVYLGEAVHKGKSYPGEHRAIVNRVLWKKVHAILAENARTRANRTRAGTPAPLKGLLRCTACGAAMTPSHTRRRGRLYRYYVCLKGMKNGAESCPVRSVAAAEIEGVVLGQVRRLLQAPEIVARTVAACHELSDGDGDAGAREREVHEALGRLDEVWDELFPAEQTRILRLLVEGIDVAPDGIDVRLRTAGIHSLVGELIAEGGDGSAAGADALTEEAAA
jgi:DNA invertase Pin-like site-specific DNA recombinase